MSRLDNFKTLPSTTAFSATFRRSHGRFRIKAQAFWQVQSRTESENWFMNMHESIRMQWKRLKSNRIQDPGSYCDGYGAGFWGFSRDNMLIWRQAYGFPRVSCFAYAPLHHCSENGVELNRCLLPLSISVYNRLHHIDYFFVFVPNENNQIRTETETDEIQQDWERNALSFARFSDPKPAWFVQGWRSLAGHWSQVTWHKMTIFVIIQS